MKMLRQVSWLSGLHPSPAFPVQDQWQDGAGTRRSQLRGQPRISGRNVSPAPDSLSIPSRGTINGASLTVRGKVCQSGKLPVTGQSHSYLPFPRPKRAKQSRRPSDCRGLSGLVMTSLFFRQMLPGQCDCPVPGPDVRLERTSIAPSERAGSMPVTRTILCPFPLVPSRHHAPEMLRAGARGCD
jgi:hypothetical protein